MALVNRRRARPRSEGRNNPFGYLFIAPALLLYLVFSIWPVVRGVAMAFTDFRFIYPETRWDFNGLTNFREMWNDDDFWQSLGVSLRYTAFVLPVTVLLSCGVAIVISKVTRGAGFYRWLVYLPVILPVAVTYLMFGEMYNSRLGFINSLLRDYGMRRPPNWLGDPEYALTAIGVSDIWRGFGFPTLLFLVGIYAIDSEIYEAAAIDGASGWQQVVHITVPLLKPVFALVIVLGLASIPGVTEPMLLLTNGAPQETTRSLGLYSYQTAFQMGDLRLGYAAAMSLVLGVGSALVALLVFFALRRDSTAGVAREPAPGGERSGSRG
jgi:ABC-type sugar transport system permease subunit